MLVEPSGSRDGKPTDSIALIGSFSHVEIARSITQRLIGLIGRGRIAPGTAFVIPGCRQVHTFFMRFAIDVIHVDREWRVVCVRRNLVPWRIGPYCPKSAYAIEVPAGAASEVEVGDILRSEDSTD